MASEHQAKLSLQKGRQAKNRQPPLRIEMPTADFLNNHKQREAWLNFCHQERMARCDRPIHPSSEKDDYFQGFDSQSPNEQPTVQHIEHMNWDNARATQPASIDLMAMSKAELSRWNPSVSAAYRAHQEGRLFEFIPAAELEHQSPQLPGNTPVPPYPASVQCPAMKVANLARDPPCSASVALQTRTQGPAMRMSIANLIHHPTPAQSPAQEHTQLPSFASLLASTQDKHDTCAPQQLAPSSLVSDDSETLDGSPDESGLDCIAGN